MSKDDVRQALAHGQVIEDYPDDEPLPSALILGWAGQRPLHLVVAVEHGGQTCHIVTVYVPSLQKWETGYRTRRPK